MQDGHALPVKAGGVQIDPMLPLVVSIPHAFIPQGTEETLFRILGGNFIFKTLDNGWLQVVIPAAFTYQDTSPFQVAFLSVGSESHIDGNFVLKTPKNPTGISPDFSAGNFFPNYFFLTLFLVVVLAFIFRFV